MRDSRMFEIAPRVRLWEGVKKSDCPSNPPHPALSPRGEGV